MGKIKVYLAGKMSGLTFEMMNSWRADIKNKLEAAAEYAGETIDIVNPVDYYNFEIRKHQTEEEVQEYDLAHVISSDIIVVNLDGFDSSDGTKIELHDAKYHNKIPVIAFGDKSLYDNLHPWVKRDITRVENGIIDVVNYIRDFYLR